MADTVKEELLSIPQDDFLDSYETCRMLCDTAFDAHYVYWKMIDICEEHIRGKKPKDPQKLKKASMDWANNWNFLKARSKITSIVLENIEMIKNSMRMAIPEFNRKTDLKVLENQDDRGTIAMKISRVFYESLEKESNLNNWINKIEYPSTSFGYTPVVFDGEENWMGDPIHPRNIAFEDHTEPERIKVFVIFKILKASELWQKWIAAMKVETREMVSQKNNDRATDISITNWSVNGLQRVLWNALNQEIKSQQGEQNKYKDWESVTNSIKSGERSIQYFINNTNNVKIGKIFYKELSEKWTEVYIPYLNDWNGAQGNETDGDHIIFKKKHGKKHQDGITVLIRDSSFTEGGYISELRGIAKYVVEDSMRFNRKKNNIEDKLIFSGSPFFEQRNTQQKEAFKITPSQGFTLVKQGFDLIPNQPSFDLSNHIVSIQIDEQHFNRETQHFDAKLEGRLTSRPVKDEVQQKSDEVRRSRSSKNSVKFSDYSKLLLNVLKNLTKVEKPDSNDYGYQGYNYFHEEMEYELTDYLEQEGIEYREFIRKLISSVSAFEIEPVISDETSLQVAISMAETSFARNRLKRMLLMSQGFPRKEIDRIAPLTTDSMRNLGDERVARIENDMFWNSGDAIVDGRDDHIDHLNEHYKKFNQTVQAVQAGRIDIIQAFKYLANLLSHTEQHLIPMSQDPTLQNQYEALLNSQNEFTQILSKIRSAAEQELQRRQKEEQNSIPPEKLKEIQLKEWEAVQKQKRTDMLTEHKRQSTIRDQAHRQALEENQQAFEQRMERIRVESERELDTIREAAKLF